MLRVNAAVFAPAATDAVPAVPIAADGDPAPPPGPEPIDEAMVRAQVLLDRANFSPGVIDGLAGENVVNAIRGYQRANGLPETGALDAGLIERLAQADPAPALQPYTISAADAAGPFLEAIPKAIEAQAALPGLHYTSVQEALAEKFHMDVDLLMRLNPGAAFAAGETIVVTAPSQTLSAAVTRIEVDTARKQLRAYGADGALLAAYPATIGSEDLPSPSGSMEVRAVAPAPNYTYDPGRLSYATGSEVHVVPPGPNNPVGGTWIDLTKDSYGIHGTPEPALVGKTASHGCVRLTNWDAAELGRAVAPGTVVVFL